MVVIIMHPTEELKLSAFQKELISDLFEETRILYAEKPLWINCPDSIYNEEIISVDFLKITIIENSIVVPVEIKTKEKQYFSKLTLVRLHKGRDFSDDDRQKLVKIKQPVKALKVFRLGLEKELSHNSKCITESKWYKLR